MKGYFGLPFAYPKRHPHYRSTLYSAVTSLFNTSSSKSSLCRPKNSVKQVPALQLCCGHRSLESLPLWSTRFSQSVISWQYVTTYLPKLECNRSSVPSVKLSNHFTVYWGAILRCSWQGFMRKGLGGFSGYRPPSSTVMHIKDTGLVI